MANCPKCGVLLKSGNKCQLCEHVIIEEDNTPYVIPKKSKKQIEVTKRDIAFFKEIWNERPHICEVSGEPLEEFNVCYFSHVLTKKAYPRFRHNKKNIVLCTFDWHQKWETGARKQKELQWINELEQILKREYYTKSITI